MWVSILILIWSWLWGQMTLPEINKRTTTCNRSWFKKVNLSESSTTFGKKDNRWSEKQRQKVTFLHQVHVDLASENYFYARNNQCLHQFAVNKHFRLLMARLEDTMYCFIVETSITLLIHWISSTVRYLFHLIVRG